MRRFTMAAALAGLFAGAVAGFALGIFVYPFWFLREAAHETLAPAPDRVTVASGTFTHVNPLDPVHWGRGMASLYEEPKGATVFLHQDFEVGPGPRFHVYLASRGAIASGADFEASETIDLGRLKAFKGSQAYGVPAGTDLSRFGSVVIWCKEFSVLISPASLARPQAALRPARLVAPGGGRG